MINLNIPENIFDLAPDELDWLIEFRKLSPEKQKEFLKHFENEPDDVN